MDSLISNSLPRASRLSGLLILVLLVLPATAWAGWPSLAQPPEDLARTGEHDVAIIVAVEDYAFLPDISGAVKNASAWESFFRRGLGAETVYVLLDRDATREQMLHFAKKAASQVSPKGNLWWVFIGHGAPKTGGADGLMVAMDAQQTVVSLQANSLAQNELLGILGAGDQAHTIVLIDACFSGRARSGAALAEGVQPVVPVKILPTLRANMVVLTAAKSNEFAGQLEAADQPAFSYLMLGALRGWADGGDRQVSAREALFFTRYALRGVKGRQQTPQIFGSADITLASGAHELAPWMRNPVPSDASEHSDTNEWPDGNKTEREESNAMPLIIPPPPGTAGEPHINPDIDTQSPRVKALFEYQSKRIFCDTDVLGQCTQYYKGSRTHPVAQNAEFYRAIERPKLAEEYTPYKENTTQTIMGYVGCVMGSAITGMLAGAIIASSTTDISATIEESEAATETGITYGTSIGAAAGLSAVVIGLSLGISAEQEEVQPLSRTDRQRAAREYNRKLRHNLGLPLSIDQKVASESLAQRPTTPISRQPQSRGVRIGLGTNGRGLVMVGLGVSF